ncbi:MAG: methyltransferase domain-containing protein [Candidatus Cyclobacteriaceae bacterium M3_2C_046]
MNTKEIDKRYTELAEDSCCLSCGGALNYADPFPGEVCLDLGSGRGTDVIRLAQEVGAKGKAYGIDVSAGMLEKARRNAKKLGVTNVEFLNAELEHLPLPDHSVNLVISNCTLNHAEDKVKVWSEVFRLLKKGGRFVVSDIYSLQEVPLQYRKDPVAVSECWAGAIEKDIYLEILNKTGFKDIKIIEESAPYPKGKIEVASFTIAGIKPF